jgi:hypothetical protein
LNRDLSILLNKLISYRAGKARYIGAMLALSLSIILLLLAVQIQMNFNQLLKSENAQDSVANFLVINRELTDANIGNTSLPDTLIEDIKKQSFTTAIGFLEASRFKASIESNSSRFPFYTDIAFESTPTDFIDVDSKEWRWEEGDNTIPVIVPTQFLDIYNFQFSLSQNLPQLTPAVVKMILFKITIYGSNNQVSFNGRVVGFSDRISSMLVPSSFMQWANERYASTVSKNPSRVIIKTKDPSNPSLTTYLQAKGLKTDTEKTRFSKYRRIVDIAVWILGGSGLLMLVFAILIFTLFIQLTVASCKPEIILLITLGCSPKQLYILLMKRFFLPGIALLFLGTSITALCQYTGYSFLLKQQIVLSPLLSIYTIITAGILLLLIWMANHISIRNTIAKQSDNQ